MANASHNALKEKSPGALTKGAPYRHPSKPVSALDIGNKDPNREYRFISKSMLTKFGGFDRRGFVVLDEKNSKGETLKSQWGEQIIGSGITNQVEDLVVAFIPKEVAEAKRESLRSHGNSVKARIQGFRSQAQSTGIKVEGDVSSQRDGVTETY